MEKSFLDFREEPVEPQHQGLHLEIGEESNRTPPPQLGGRSRRRRASLRSTGELLRDSWDIFKTRFLVLVGLYLLPVFLMLGIGGGTLPVVGWALALGCVGAALIIPFWSAWAGYRSR